MQPLNEEIVKFFYDLSFTVVSTIDKEGYPHNSCKDIVAIDPQGIVYLLDVYHGITTRNLVENPHVSLTGVDEHKFKGYCLKGKAKISQTGDLRPDLMKVWEERITGRITRRLIKNITGEKGHPRHPEAMLPDPKSLIEIQVDEIVDLTPHNLKHF